MSILALNKVNYSYKNGKKVLNDVSIEFEKGNISLVKWNIESQESGVLWVRRKVITGPYRLENYLLWARDERIRMIEEEKKKK